MIAVYNYVVYSKNIMFLKYILFAHRNNYCIHMLLSGKTEVASPEKLSAHNQSRFRVQQYDRILAPDSVFYSELHRYVVQSGTWSAGQKEIRGTSIVQSSHESKRKTQTNKNDKEKGTRITKYTCQKKIDDGHSIERVWHSASREPSDTLPGSQPCTQTRSIYHIPYSQGFSFH